MAPFYLARTERRKSLVVIDRAVSYLKLLRSVSRTEEQSSTPEAIVVEYVQDDPYSMPLPDLAVVVSHHNTTDAGETSQDRLVLPETGDLSDSVAVYISIELNVGRLRCQSSLYKHTLLLWLNRLSLGIHYALFFQPRRFERQLMHLLYPPNIGLDHLEGHHMDGKRVRGRGAWKTLEYTELGLVQLQAFCNSSQCLSGIDFSSQSEGNHPDQTREERGTAVFR